MDYDGRTNMIITCVTYLSRNCFLTAPNNSWDEFWDEIELQVTDAIKQQEWPGETVAELGKFSELMFFDANNKSKSPDILLQQLRKCHELRENLLQSSSGAADDELSVDQVKECYQNWAQAFLESELTPLQCKDKRYQIKRHHNTISLTSFQRSFIDAMLRKNVGHKFIAYLIWQIGMPQLLQASGHLDWPTDLSITDAGEVLQSPTCEIVEWLGLRNEIARRKQSDEYKALVSLSGTTKGVSGEDNANKARKRTLHALKDALLDGEEIRRRIDNDEVEWDELSPAEQVDLEDYDTGRAEKARKALTLQKPPPFRVQRSSIHDF